MLLMPPQRLSGHLLPAQWSCHIITGCCGSIWGIIPNPCLDGLCAHVQGEVHTQDTQPELEVFASFAVSGMLWAARWILQHRVFQVLQPHSDAGKAQLPISGIQNSGGFKSISSAKPVQRSYETLLNQYKLRWYQFKCNSLGTNQSQSKIILC